MSLNFRNLFWASILAGGLAFFLAFIILPALVTDLITPLNVLNIASAVNLITWLEQIIIFVFFALLVIFLGNTQIGKRREKALNPLLRAYLASFLYSVYLLSQASFLILAYSSPELFQGLSFLEKLINFYRYPSVLVIQQGDPLVIWLIFTILVVFLFNLKMYLLEFRKGD